jgi:hypothetical protein
MPGLGFDIVERHSATVGTGRSACAKLRTMPQPLSPAPILVFMQMFGSETEQVGESLIKHRRACSRIKQKAVRIRTVHSNVQEGEMVVQLERDGRCISLNLFAR